MVEHMGSAGSVPDEALKDEVDEEPGLKFEDLLKRFLDKMSMIPEELHEGLGDFYAFRQIQDQRKRLGNKRMQIGDLEKPVDQQKRVFWAHLNIPNTGRMIWYFDNSIDALAKIEQQVVRRLQRSLGSTSWYREVAVPAARGFGISDSHGAVSAAKILNAIGSPSRFPAFGNLVQYCRLAPTTEGKAPRRSKGQRVRYNVKAWQALFDLTEVWLRMTDCDWRKLWEDWKPSRNPGRGFRLALVFAMPWAVFALVGFVISVLYPGLTADQIAGGTWIGGAWEAGAAGVEHLGALTKSWISILLLLGVIVVAGWLAHKQG